MITDIETDRASIFYVNGNNTNNKDYNIILIISIITLVFLLLLILHNLYYRKLPLLVTRGKNGHYTFITNKSKATQCHFTVYDYEYDSYNIYFAFVCIFLLMNILALSQ